MMRAAVCRLVVAVVMLWPLIAQNVAPVQAEPFNRGEVMTREVTATLNGATMDDYMIELARAADVNVIADATEFPEPSAVKAYPGTSGAIAGLQGPHRDKWGPSLINLLGDFAAQKKLSALRPNARTFLFWSEPDPLELVRLMLPDPNSAQNQPEAEELAQRPMSGALRDYLKASHGWAGRAAERHAKVDIQARVADLPPPLRALVLAEVRRQLIPAEGALPLQDEFWERARVKIRSMKIPPANEAVSYFVVKAGDDALEFHVAELGRLTAPSLPSSTQPAAANETSKKGAS